MSAYYNEFDPKAGVWLRWLIANKLIADGTVDTRSITEVQPDDLIGFTQCHFFAGIGGWSHAARLAGWADDRPLWTGSCPCQPFSQAGKGGGVDDVRHLWPDFFRLIRACRPPVVMGEQVAGSAGYGWFDGVGSDLAGEDYASRCVDIPSCAVDAPHIRSRLYWLAVADADKPVVQHIASAGQQPVDEPDLRHDEGSGPSGPVDVANAQSLHSRGSVALGGPQGRNADRRADADVAHRPGSLGDGRGAGSQGEQDAERVAGAASRRTDAERTDGGSGRFGVGHNSGPSGFWSGHDWIICGDGKARRVADASAPLLVNGVSGGVAVRRPESLGPATEEDGDTRIISRVAAWRGFGNAINPVLAAEVIAAFMEGCRA